MAIQREIWAADIAANIHKYNAFVRMSINDDDKVNGKTVHLPQSGASPTVVRNRSSYPATAAQRTDTIISYDIQDFTSDPTHVTDLELREVSYDKRADVLMDHQDTINDKVGSFVPYAWAPASASMIVSTSGADRTGTAPGATGTRKRITKEDLLSAKEILDSLDIPSEGRVILLNSAMYNDLLRDDDLLDRDFMNNGNLPDGVVSRVLGFNVFMRSLVGRYATASNTPKDPDAANAATDNAFALLWHPRFVRYAFDATKVFYDEDKADYYGGLFSAEARCGASVRYTNYRGVVAIRETT